MRRNLKHAQYLQLQLNYNHDTQVGGRAAAIVRWYDKSNFRLYERGTGYPG